jgi:hypothetical protein
VWTEQNVIGLSSVAATHSRALCVHKTEDGRPRHSSSVVRPDTYAGSSGGIGISPRLNHVERCTQYRGSAIRKADWPASTTPPRSQRPQRGHNAPQTAAERAWLVPWGRMGELRAIYRPLHPLRSMAALNRLLQWLGRREPARLAGAERPRRRERGRPLMRTGEDHNGVNCALHSEVSACGSRRSESRVSYPSEDRIEHSSG